MNESLAKYIIIGIGANSALAVLAVILLIYAGYGDSAALAGLIAFASNGIGMLGGALTPKVVASITGQPPGSTPDGRVIRRVTEIDETEGR